MDDIIIKNLNKSFGEKIVIKNYSDIIKAQKVNFIIAKSGAGKTTLVKIMMGLEKADGGYISNMDNIKISAVFQEDRLCEKLDAVANIRLINPENSKEYILKKLEEFGLKDINGKKIENLSGGMKRRVSILRAILAKFDIIFFDEPFQGLDYDTKINTINQINKHIKGKTAIIITHDPTDIEFFDYNILNFN